MSLITLSGVCFAFGSREIIRDANLTIGPQDRLGLIGANGSGKTTLLRIITGSRRPDRGQIIRRSGLDIGLLAQEVGRPPDTTPFELSYAARPHLARLTSRLEELEELLAGGEADDAALNEYADLQQQAQQQSVARYRGQVVAVLRALGITTEQLDQPLATMSGGEGTRARLAAVLLGEHDLLLLDEPTNHLDLQAIEWLESFLLGCGKPFIVVSHDRYFLDRVTNRTVEIEEARLTAYKGNYTAFTQEKRRLIEQQTEDYERQQAVLARMKEFVDKWRSGTRARQAASRQKAIDRIVPLERPWARNRAPSVSFGNASRTPRMVFALQGVAKRYGDRTIFEGLDLEVERGERIGLMGPNGSGKTTFMRLLTGEEEPDEGEVVVAKELVVAYFDQHLADLNERNTVFEELLEVADLPTARARDFLGQFLFSGENIFKEVSALSGGERNRLMLAKMVALRPSVLLLDEPTNHLDIYGREALESALTGFDGTLVFTTHDRRFLERLAQRICTFGDGAVEVKLGGYSPTPAEVAADPFAIEEEIEDFDWIRRPTPPKPRAARKKRPAAAAGPDPAALAKELETRIAERESALAELENRLADPATYQDGNVVREVTMEHARLRQELDELYDRWALSPLPPGEG